MVMRKSQRIVIQMKGKKQYDKYEDYEEEDKDTSDYEYVTDENADNNEPAILMTQAQMKMSRVAVKMLYQIYLTKFVIG